MYLTVLMVKSKKCHCLAVLNNQLHEVALIALTLLLYIKLPNLQCTVNALEMKQILSPPKAVDEWKV